MTSQRNGKKLVCLSQAHKASICWQAPLTYRQIQIKISLHCLPLSVPLLQASLWVPNRNLWGTRSKINSGFLWRGSEGAWSFLKFLGTIRVRRYTLLHGANQTASWSTRRQKVREEPCNLGTGKQEINCLCFSGNTR